MEELIALWLPILVATIALHFASMIAWTVSPHHKPDILPLPDDEKVNQLIAANSLGPGAYMFPGVCFSDMKNPEVKARYEAGPHGLVTIWPKPNMGKNIMLTLLFFFVSSIFIAYLTSAALDPGATFSKVFQIAGTAGIMTFCFASIPNDIWFTKPRRWFLMNIIDGVIYGLIAGAVFGWLWPGV